MDSAGGRQFKDFAGYLWEAFEVKGREAGVPPGFRRIFFRSLDHPHLPPVPGPITTAPLGSLSLEQLRGFIKLGHAFPQADSGGGPKRAPTRDEWESFLTSVGSGPAPRDPIVPKVPTPPTGSAPDEEPLYPNWLEDALEGGADADPLPMETETNPFSETEDTSEDDGAWSPAGPVHRRHLYRGFESARLIPHRFHARVRVGLGEQEFVGEAEGADVPGARVDVAARATLVALQNAEANRVELALQGAKLVRAFDRSVVVVGIYGLKGREVTFLVGASLARDSIEHAAILATLQATGRWLAWAASQKPNGRPRDADR